MLAFIGVGDSAYKHNHFHPFAAAVVSDETQETYEWIFKKFKKVMNDTLQFIYDPDNLLADGALAIRGAFLKIFVSDKLMRICYFHMFCSTQKKKN